MLIDGMDQFLALRVFVEEPILNLHVETNHLQYTGSASVSWSPDECGNGV